MTLFWWRREQQRKKAARQTPPRPRRKSKWQPNVEVLEDRMAPAIHVWSGLDSSLWSNMDNWSSGGVPQGPATEVGPLILIFPTGSRAVSVNDLGAGSLTVGEIDITGTPGDAASFNISGNAINLGDGGINAGHIEDSAGANPNDVINFTSIDMAASAAEVLPPNPGAFFTGHDFSKDGPGSLRIDSPLTGAGANVTINYAPFTAHTPSAGDGEVVLTNANSYTGTTAVGGGVLSVGNDLALGDPVGTPATGTFLVPASLGGTGGNIELHGPNSATPINVANEFLFMASTGSQSEDPATFHPPAPSNRQFDNDTNGDSWGGHIVLATPGTTVTTFYTVAGTTLTLTGPITGVAGNALVKAGPGTLILAGNDAGQANTYSGLTVVNEGTLVAAKNTALGAQGSPGSGGDTILNNAGKLELNADINGNPIAIGDEGVTVNGTPGVRIEDVSTGPVTNSLDGDIVLNTDTTIKVDNLGVNLVHTAVVLGNGITTNTTATLTKDGAGTLTLGGPLPNLYTGGTAVNQGILVGAKTNAFGPQFNTFFPFAANEVDVNNGAVLAFSGGTALVHHVIPNDIDINSTGADNPNGPTTTAHGTPIAGSQLWNQSGFTDLGTTTDSATVSLSQATSIRSDSGNLVIRDAINSVPAPPGGGEEEPPSPPIIVEVSKDGPGKVTFAGNNTYGGDTTVNEGELDLSSGAFFPHTGDRSIPANLFVGQLGGPAATVRFTNSTNQFAQVDGLGNITALTTIKANGTVIVGPAQAGVSSPITAPIGPIDFEDGTIQILLGNTLQMSGPPGGVDVLVNASSIILGNSPGSFLDLNGANRTFQVNGGATLTVNPTVEDATGSAAGLIKQGDATMILNGDNIYDGVTDIEMGLLDINGFQNGSPVNIAPAGTLGGVGTTGPVGTSPQTDLGVIDPAGPSATGTLTTDGDVTFSTTGAPGGNSRFDVDVTTATQHDLYHVTGSALNLGNADLHVLSGALNAPVGTTIVILQADAGVFGQFANAPEGSIVPGTSFRVHYTATQVQLTTVAVTPLLTVTGPTSASFGQTVTFTATVTDPTDARTPTGTITFHDGVGGPILGTVALTPTATPGQSTASLPISSLSVGPHTIEAVYNPDASSPFGAVTATTNTQIVVSPAATTTTLTAVPSTTTAGSTALLTATIAVTPPGSGTPTGIVSFVDRYFAPGNNTAVPTSTTTIGVGTVSGNQAALVTGPLAAGKHVFQAVYGGDTNFAGSSSQATTNATNTVTVSTANSTTSLAIVPSSVAQGGTTTLTATVTGVLSPSGTVTFTDTTTGTPLGTATLVPGTTQSVATLPISTAGFTIGNHAIIAVYSGDVNNNPSTSPAQILTVTVPVPETIPGPTFPANANITNLIEIIRFKPRFRPRKGDFVVPIGFHNISGKIITAARAFFLGLPKTFKIEAPTFSGQSRGVPGVPNGTTFLELSEAINSGYTVFLHMTFPSAKAAQNFDPRKFIQILAGS